MPSSCSRQLLQYALELIFNEIQIPKGKAQMYWNSLSIFRGSLPQTPFLYCKVDSYADSLQKITNKFSLNRSVTQNKPRIQRRHNYKSQGLLPYIHPQSISHVEFISIMFLKSAVTSPRSVKSNTSLSWITATASFLTCLRAHYSWIIEVCSSLIPCSMISSDSTFLMAGESRFLTMAPLSN